VTPSASQVPDPARGATPQGDLQVSGRHHHLSPAEIAAMEEKIRKIEFAISLVLRVGVILSVSVIAIGLAVMFYHHGDYTSITGHASYKTLTSRSTPFPHTLGQLRTSLAHGDGRGIVVLGVFLLILTPILRVAVGVVSFLYEKDVPMALVTLFVLVVLIGSFFLAGV
jgi:uncharacterized membrane protein